MCLLALPGIVLLRGQYFRRVKGKLVEIVSSAIKNRIFFKLYNQKCRQNHKKCKLYIQKSGIMENVSVPEQAEYTFVQKTKYQGDVYMHLRLF